MTIPESKIYSAVPVVNTNNIEESLAYYTVVLGFEFDFKYGDPVDYAGVKSGDVEIYFTRVETFSPPLEVGLIHPKVFIWVHDANALFQGQVTKGAKVVEAVSDRPWGARQYVVTDNNGYYLKITQPI